MTCAGCRAVADPYLSGELPEAGAREVAAHLETCAECRVELEARRALRKTLREAIERSPILAPDESFVRDVRARLKDEHDRLHRQRVLPSWLAIAAGIVLVAGLGWGVMWMVGSGSATIDWARLAVHAAGDHRYCALQHALDEAPISLEEAARRYDPMYGGLQQVIETSEPVRAEDVVLLGAHACVFQGRRFGHVVARRGDHVVSILVTDADDRSRAARVSTVAACGPADGFQVACSTAGGRLVFVVSDLPQTEHLTLARALSTPLHRYLTPARASM
jgi:anti-sigma factor RsiW